VRLLVNFIVHPKGEDESAESMSASMPWNAAWTARNLASFFALNYENPNRPPSKDAALAYQV